MPRFICSICSAPPDVLQAVNNALLAGESGRKIAARSAFSKSSLYRHKAACFPRETIRRHRDRIAVSQNPGRIIVKWADNTCTIATKRGDAVPFDTSELGANDVLLVVQFDKDDASIRNPPALYAEALAEDAERFPAEEVSEEIKGCKEIKIVADDFETVEAVPTPCSHDWRSPAAGIERCTKCGEQKPVVQVFGISRAEHDKQRGSRAFRGIFGRFG